MQEIFDSKLERLVYHMQKNIVHECGIVGAFNIPNASEIIRNMGCAQQGRGSDGSGIATYDGGKFNIRKDLGSFLNVFPEKDNFNDLPGKIGIGHGWYSTCVSGDTDSLQPFLFESKKYGPFLVTTNGQLLNHDLTRNDLKEKGYEIKSHSDSELIGHKLIDYDCDNIEDALKQFLRDFPCSYSLLVMTENSMYAALDKHGIRPLSLAKMGDGYLIASENGVFRSIPKAKFIRDISPGELLRFDYDRPLLSKSSQVVQPEPTPCSLEFVYFSFPRSSYNGCMHEDFRFDSGVELFKENKPFFESLLRDYGRKNIAIVPILNSGKHGAYGLNHEFDINRLREYFMRRTDIPGSFGRSFTESNDDLRLMRAMLKLDLYEEKVKGKIIITFDDTIVRGNTSKVNNQRLWDAGARMVINVIGSPALTSICFNGIDLKTYCELLAYNKLTNQERADDIRASNLLYLSENNYASLLERKYGISTACKGCFGGPYPELPHNFDILGRK